MKSLVVALLLLPAAGVAAENLGLPFSGRWFVTQGGDTPNVNHHMTTPAQAYGIDFGKVGGPNGRDLTRRSPLRVADYYSWDEDVLAPADGTVVAIVAGLRDNPLGSRDTQNPVGNHVVIRIHESRFVFLGHLQQNTVTVRPGDSVRRAQPLGRCGNSGNSDFPHVHLHVQDTPAFGEGNGQNSIFGPIDVELTGKRLEAVAWPLIRGLFVSNSVSSAAQQLRFTPLLGSLAALPKPLQRTSDSSVQLTLGGVWRHTLATGSDPVSALAGRLSPIR